MSGMTPSAWAPRAAAAMAARAAQFATESEGRSPEARQYLGLRAAWLAWRDCEYSSEPPLHSKCIGFALPGEYYATYLMDRSSLERGEYAYGRDLVLGWPCEGSTFKAFPPEAVSTDERADERADDELVSMAPVYQWSGEYAVEQRPWFLHGRSTSEGGSWTPPYADPVTGEMLVSFVAPLPQPKGAVVIAGTFAAHDGPFAPPSEERLVGIKSTADGAECSTRFASCYPAYTGATDIPETHALPPSGFEEEDHTHNYPGSNLS